MAKSLVVKDAAWQILGRLISAAGWFLVVKLMTPYLGPMRFGDYSTILKYFAIRSALADFGVYVIALRELGILKKKVDVLRVDNEIISDTIGGAEDITDNTPKKIQQWSTKNALEDAKTELASYYNKFVTSRLFMIWLIYTIALVIAYLLPAYTSNPYLLRGLPIGMLFSASFMTAWILQLPLQLFRKMEQVSIALIAARIVQISALVGVVYFVYPAQSFEPVGNGIPAFVRVLVSVLLSGLAQTLYVTRKGNKLLPLRLERDKKFTRSIMKKNRQYGFAYYLSSFHTLIVLILLSNFFPTIEGYTYVGVRALALSLIEILLIVPSALWNSLIHRVANAPDEEKRESFWALASIVGLIWSVVIVNFWIFHTEIIRLIWWTKYLSTSSARWSDMLLPFLAVVLTLSFIKQVLNYLFVSVNRQNVLLWINLIGVIIGVSIWLPLIQKYNLFGWIATQLLLEICFTTWSLLMAAKRKILPKINWHSLLISLVAIFGLWFITQYVHSTFDSWYFRILACLLMNGLILVLLLKPLKIQARKL